MKYEYPRLWKVVQKRTRYSCVIPGYSKYSIKYEKGKEVEAHPKTLGILAFSDLSSAQRFLRVMTRYWGKKLELIRIKPTSKVQRRRVICDVCDVGVPRDPVVGLEKYYSQSISERRVYHVLAPQNTVSCKSAIVLD